MSAGRTLSRADIENAFRLLGERLVRRGVVADLYIMGGAAMAMAFDSRRATRDIDAIFEPHGIRLGLGTVADVLAIEDLMEHA